MAQKVRPPPPPDTPTRMTFEDYLTWARTTEHVHAEWVDGEVFVYKPNKWWHQELGGFLYCLLRDFVVLRTLGEVGHGPYAMRLRAGRSSRVPDVFYVAQDHLNRQTDDWLDGPADFVVELVSDDSATRDRRDKLAEYAEAGIPEYLIVDGRPRRQRTTFLRLSDEGFYEEVPLDAEGRYHSVVLPGFWFKPAWLW